MAKTNKHAKQVGSLQKCATGIKGLDEITGGGLPQGRPTLVCGGTGCGKTLLAMDITERKQAEKQIMTQVAELNRLNEELSSFNKVAVGRELRMIELKNVINEMCATAGLPPRYDLEFDEEPS